VRCESCGREVKEVFEVVYGGDGEVKVCRGCYEREKWLQREGGER